MKLAPLVAASLAFLPIPASAVIGEPFINSPSDGSRITATPVRIEIDASGVPNVRSIALTANKKTIGSASPTSVLGQWSFPGGHELSIIESFGGRIYLDYTTGSKVFTMEGKLTKPNVFTGTFEYFKLGSPDVQSGSCTIRFSFTANGRLTANFVGDSPLGKIKRTGGTGSNTHFRFLWKNPMAGKQTLVALVTYIDGNGATQSIKTSPITVTIVPQPAIRVDQPRGRQLVDGKAVRDFGSAKVGGRGKTKTFVIRNTGSSPLRNLRVARVGGNRKDFRSTRPGRRVLKPGQSTTFKVAFKPKALRRRTTTLRIFSNDWKQRRFDIKIKGIGR